MTAGKDPFFSPLGQVALASVSLNVITSPFCFFCFLVCVFFFCIQDLRGAPPGSCPFRAPRSLGNLSSSPSMCSLFALFFSEFGTLIPFSSGLRTNMPLKEIVQKDEGVYEEPASQPTRRKKTGMKKSSETVERLDTPEYVPPPPSEVLLDEETTKRSSKRVRTNKYGDIIED